MKSSSSSLQAGSNSARPVALVTHRARLVLLILTALVSLHAGLSNVFATLSARNLSPEISLPRSDSEPVNRIMASYEQEGIRFTARQDDALRRLLSLWESRADLKAAFQLPDGTVDIARLLTWAQINSDFHSVPLVSLRPDLVNAGARLGVMLPDGEILAVLIQHLEMREKPTIEGGGELWVLREVWMRRPELASRFTKNGRVNVKLLMEWAASNPTTDPDHGILGPIALNFQILLDDMKLQVPK